MLNVFSSALLAALVLEERLVSRPIVAQILDAVAVPNLHRPIQLLINEHRKRACLKQSIRGLPKHCSIYRDILFLTLTAFGREVRRDDFDREYAASFARLHPKIGILLPPADHPPGAAVKYCRKVFMPLDVY